MENFYGATKSGTRPFFKLNEGLSSLRRRTAGIPRTIHTILVTLQVSFRTLDSQVLDVPRKINYPYEEAVYKQLENYIDTISKILNANPPESPEAQAFKINQITKQAFHFTALVRGLQKSPENVAKIIQQLPAIKDYSPQKTAEVNAKPATAKTTAQKSNISQQIAEQQAAKKERESWHGTMMKLGDVMIGLGGIVALLGFVAPP